MEELTMTQLANCARCNEVFVKQLRDICKKCFDQEEEAFRTVYNFLRKRENRQARMMEIVEATGVEEELITKFIREQRLLTSNFPNLSYPCERCGTDITTGKGCDECAQSIIQTVTASERNEEQKINRGQDEEEISVYYTFDKDRKK